MIIDPLPVRVPLSSALFFAMLCAAPSASAQRRVDGGGRIEIHHRTKKIISGKEREESALSDVNRFEWRKGQRVSIVLADANPVAFTYDTKVTESETEQSLIAAEFAKSLAAFVAPFTTKTGGGLEPDFLVEGLPFAGVVADFSEIQRMLDEMPGVIASTLGTTAQQTEAKRTVDAWKVSALSKRVADRFGKLADMLLRKCHQDLPLGTSSGATLLCTDPLATATQRAAAAAVSAGRAAPVIPGQQGAGAPPVGGAPVVATPPVAVPPGGAAIGAGSPPKPAAGAAAGPAPAVGVAMPAGAATASAGSGQRIYDFLLTAQAMRSHVESGLATLRAFAADMDGLNTPRSMAEQTHNVKNQEIAIKIGANPKYEVFMTADTKTKRDVDVRTVSVMLQPYAPVTFSLAPAAVLVFPGTRRYSAEAAGSEFVIRRADEDGSAYDVAAMLMITPRGWDEPTIGGGFQLGVTPAKDRMALYGGLAFTAWTRFGFGGGFVWRQDDRLPRGVREGQSLATAAALKTERKFGPGGYLHITVK